MSIQERITSENGAIAPQLFENLVWMTSEEAAWYLRVSVGSLRNYVCQGRIPFYRFKRRLRFKKSDLDQLLQASKQGGK